MDVRRNVVKSCLCHQRDWDEHLQKVLFAYRTAIHESTGYSPFLVTFGRSPNLPVDVVLGRPSTSTGGVPQFVQKTQTVLHSAFLHVRQHLQQAHQRQKQVADASSVGEAFQVGDRVWLYVPKVKQGQSKKFTSLYGGVLTQSLVKPVPSTTGFNSLEEPDNNSSSKQA